jgi:hypothetical protein
MPKPNISISKRERQKYKSNIAAWEVIRKEGIVRFVLVRGVLLRGAPIVIAIAAVLSFSNNGFHIYPELILDPLNIGLFVATAIIIGIRFKLDEWQINEREYKARKGGGNALDLDDR